VGLNRSVIHFVGSADFGGTEQSLLHVLAGLEQVGWRQVLVHHPEPRLAPLVHGAQQLGVATRSVPRITDVPAARCLIDAVRHERASIFHAHLNWPLACRAGLLIAAALRVPGRVATVQLFTGGAWPVQGRLQQLLVAPTVNRFIAVSNAVASQLQANFGVPRWKLRVVHNGIPVTGFENVRPVRVAEPPVVLTIARLDAQKGLPVLLEAAASLPGVSFVVAGDGPEGPALAQRAKELGVHERVRFLGYRRDIAELLAGCDVFALPSLNEGLPLAVLEAMASHRPVVASAIPGINEVVVEGQTGLLVAPGDSAALAEAIGSVLADPQLGQRLGAAGRLRVESTFSAEAMTRGVIAIYEELLGPRPHCSERH
jgi:glycosyltransferase involved in cell wall biosynthesis